MADVSTWNYDANGNVIVTYKDGHKQSLTQAQAIGAGIIADPGTATKTGTKLPPAVKPGSYSLNSGSAIADPFGSGATAGTNFTVPINGQQIPIGTLLQKANDPKVLAQIGSALRQYGVISKGTRSQQSIINAYTSVLVKAASVAMDPNQWMQQYQSAGGGADTQASGPSTNISVRKYDPETIRTIADQIYTSKLGQRVTEADLKDLSDKLNAAEKKSPTKSIAVPNAAGSVTTTTTTGGIDEQGFITKQAEKLPEYGRMQNLQFASWLDKAISGGQTAAGSLANG